MCNVCKPMNDKCKDCQQDCCIYNALCLSCHGGQNFIPKN